MSPNDAGRRVGTALLLRFESGLDALETALRSCRQTAWRASLWRVKLTDPWMSPSGPGSVSTRTEAEVQVFSEFWLVAYHCLRFVDYYLWDGLGEWAPPARFRDGPEERPIGADGAAVLPGPAYSRAELLDYLTHCRRRAREVLTHLSDAQLERLCGPDHPHAGESFGRLLEVNLSHLNEHAEQLTRAALHGAVGRR